ncbi:hypothetical protein [Streptomyces sp. WAC 05379]|uniref:hypothetical protein n=1 Tax=Streptomyces sp. WAC 05379 TaxID=2203207 RepID=UPI000F735F94|nr:hypothetical protein [Streptomyces sp. WAC 05379]
MVAQLMGSWIFCRRRLCAVVSSRRMAQMKRAVLGREIADGGHAGIPCEGGCHEHDRRGGV